MSKRWIERLPEAAPAEPRPLYPQVILDMSLEELRAEWRTQENTLMRSERAWERLSQAVWPDGAEQPADWDERNGYCSGIVEIDLHRDRSADLHELCAGIASLHEYTSRVLEENERLRARVAELEARHG